MNIINLPTKYLSKILNFRVKRVKLTKLMLTEIFCVFLANFSVGQIGVPQEWSFGRDSL